MTDFFTVFDTTTLPILLVGETGVGKSTLVQHYADKKDKLCVRINITGQTLREDLIGRATLRDGNVTWEEGPFTSALKHGHYILLDEVNMALPEILSMFQAVLEENGKLFIPENQGEIIEPHPETRIFATMNPPTHKYGGTKNLNTATASRFLMVSIPSKTIEETRRIITEKTNDITANIVEDITTKALQYIDQHTGLPPFSLRESLMLAQLIHAECNPSTAFQMVYANKIMEEIEREKLMDAMGSVLPTNVATAKKQIEEHKRNTRKERIKVLKRAKKQQEKIEQLLASYNEKTI